MLKWINISLKWCHVNIYAFSLIKIKWWTSRAFFGLLLVTPLKPWVVDKFELSPGYFPLPEDLICQFSTLPYSHLAGYVDIYYKYTYKNN